MKVIAQEVTCCCGLTLVGGEGLRCTLTWEGSLKSLQKSHSLLT
jgi:hypothetical protein